MKCQKCNTDNVQKAIYCRNCGARLHTEIQTNNAKDNSTDWYAWFSDDVKESWPMIIFAVVVIGLIYGLIFLLGG